MRNQTLNYLVAGFAAAALGVAAPAMAANAAAPAAKAHKAAPKPTHHKAAKPKAAPKKK